MRKSKKTCLTKTKKVRFKKKERKKENAIMTTLSTMKKKVSRKNYDPTISIFYKFPPQMRNIL